ncbi:MAG TPA: hypothetical protein VGH35_04765 [Gaiellaceae bacterium]
MPWRRPRHELLLLVLVGIAALLPLYGISAQDQSRLCLTHALLHGRLSSDECLASSVDKARYGDHLYSDKAPGLSALEVPAAAAVRLPAIDHDGGRSTRVWAVRVLSSGLAFLLGALLVGRVAEGLAPGYGGRALVAYSLGMLVAPLAAANFGHGTAGTIALAAFLLAWRRRFLTAGLLGGAAVLVEYQAAAILVAVAIYAAFHGRRPAAAYVAGAVPAFAILGAYDLLAFGSPWHLSYRYVVGSFAPDQASGFFGIGSPRLDSFADVLVGNRGLLVVSPVVAAAAWGLVLLGRRHRAEALVCGAVTVFFVVLNSSYFLPYGGGSPGPRFLVPALPFLALGLGPALARAPRTAGAVALASIIATVTLTLVWAANVHLRESVWGELARAVSNGRWSRLGRSATETVVGDGWLVVIAAAAAVAVAFAPPPRRLVARVRRRPLVLAVCAAAAVAAAAGVIRLATLPPDLRASIQSTASAALPGDEVDFAVTLDNRMQLGLRHVRLTVSLPPGMKLLGRPYFERGSGCIGTTRISCNLDFLGPGMGTVVRLGVRVAPTAARKLTVSAWGSTGRTTGPRAATSVVVGAA